MKANELRIYTEDRIIDRYIQETGKEDTDKAYEELNMYMKSIGFVRKDDLFIGLQTNVFGVVGNDILHYECGNGEEIEINGGNYTTGTLCIEKSMILSKLKEEIKTNETGIFTEEICNRIMNTDESFYDIIGEIIDEYTRSYVEAFVKKEIEYNIDLAIKGKIQWK